MNRTIVIIVMFLLSTLVASCVPGLLDTKVNLKKHPNPIDKIKPDGVLEISGSTYSYGLQSLHTSVDKIFYVKNIGLGAVSEMAGGGLFTPFAFKGNQYPGTGGSCGETLEASSICTIVVSYTPTTSIPHSGTISISYSSGSENKIAQKTISGTGAAGTSANLIISDGVTYNFGSKYLNASTDKVFTVSNSGAGSAAGMSGSGLVAPFAFKGGSYPGIGGTCGSTLPVSGSCMIVVTYTPTTVANHNGTIIINYHNGLSAQSTQKNLIGIGVAAPTAHLSIANGVAYNFGAKVINTSTDKTFFINNSGGGAATAMSGSALVAPFMFKGGSYPGTGGDCGAVLSAAATCSIVVTYIPTTIATHNSIIQVNYNNGISSQTAQVNISGTGAAVPTAILVISDGTTYNYGSKTINTSTDKIFTISNVGTAQATAISGIGPVAPFKFKGGSYPGTGGNCGTTLAASGSCSIVVVYTPTTVAVHSGTITLNYHNGVLAQTVQRNITGTGLAVQVATLTISDGATYNYGSKTVNTSTDKIFTISNSGAGSASAMSGSGLVAPFKFKGGSYPGTGGNCGATLASSGSCTFVVTYNPTTVAVHSGTITINYNNGVTAQTVQRNITGTGLAVPAATLVISDGATYNYGSKTLNTSTDKIFTISNSGAVSASAISSSGLVAPFTFKGGSYPGTGGSCLATLVGSGTCTIVVTYTPTTVAVHGGTITINYNNGVSVQTSQRSVTGTGVAAPNAILTISDGATYNYGSRTINTSTDKVFTITNSGAASATVISGSGLVAPFTFKGGSYPGTGGTCGATLVASGTCKIVVTYTPTTIAVHSGTITINFNDGVATKTTQRNITGTGVAVPIAILTISDGPIYDFGTKELDSVTDKVFTISNSGLGAASAISATNLLSPFTFKGDSYPGTGGNCGVALAAASSCTIVVTYIPASENTHNDTIIINYNNGISVQATQRDITGTGIYSALISKEVGWDANPTVEVVVGYKLYFGTAPGTYNGGCVNTGENSPIIVPVAGLSDPNYPSYVFNGFKSDTPCYFSISAYNNMGESARTNDLVYTP